MHDHQHLKSEAPTTEAARRGGVATLAKHGPAHYRRMAQRRMGATRFLPGLGGLRRARGLTSAELARLARLHVNTVSAVELGYQPARPRTVAKLAAALRVRPEALYLAAHHPAAHAPALHRPGA
jgi:hypothetical protein